MAFQPPIPARYPFSRQPIRWASPPGPGEYGTVPGPGGPTGPNGGLSNASLSSMTFAVRGTGVVGAAFPNLVRVASQSFGQQVGILGVSLTASIVNAAPASTAIIAIHRDIGATLSIATGTDFYVEYTVEQGLAHSIRTGTSFSDNLAPYFGGNEAMAIYALMLNAGNAYTAIVSIRYLVLS